MESELRSTVVSYHVPHLIGFQAIKVSQQLQPATAEFFLLQCQPVFETGIFTLAIDTVHHAHMKKTVTHYSDIVHWNI